MPPDAAPCVPWGPSSCAHAHPRSADAGSLFCSLSCAQLRLSPGTPDPPGPLPVPPLGPLKAESWVVGGLKARVPASRDSPSFVARCLVSSGPLSSVLLFTRVCACAGGRDKSGPCASSCGPHRGVLRGTRSPVGGLPAARSCPCEAPSWHLALTGGVPVRWVTAGGPRGGPRPPPAPTAHAAGLVPGGWGPVWEARQPRAGWTRQPHWAPPGAQPPGDLPVWPAAPQHGSPGAPRDPVAFPRPVTAV